MLGIIEAVSGLRKVYKRLCSNAYRVCDNKYNGIQCKYCDAEGEWHADAITRFASGYVHHLEDCPLMIAEREMEKEQKCISET
jgi:hypothetical protein